MEATFKHFVSHYREFLNAILAVVPEVAQAWPGRLETDWDIPRGSCLIRQPFTYVMHPADHAALQAEFVEQDIIPVPAPAQLGFVLVLTHEYALWLKSQAEGRT